jgi:[calcium/calmodulin-dependent protein kinase] kinase
VGPGLAALPPGSSDPPARRGSDSSSDGGGDRETPVQGMKIVVSDTSGESLPAAMAQGGPRRAKQRPPLKVTTAESAGKHKQPRKAGKGKGKRGSDSDDDSDGSGREKKVRPGSSDEEGEERGGKGAPPPKWSPRPLLAGGAGASSKDKGKDKGKGKGKGASDSDSDSDSGAGGMPAGDSDDSLENSELPSPVSYADSPHGRGSDSGLEDGIGQVPEGFRAKETPDMPLQPANDQFTPYRADVLLPPTRPTHKLRSLSEPPAPALIAANHAEARGSADEKAPQHTLSVQPPTLERRPTIETDRVYIFPDRDGRKHVNQFVIKGVLGQGRYGKVRLVQSTADGNYYAMKSMSKSRLRKLRTLGAGRVQDSWDKVKREVAIMKKLSHPNVVRLYEVIDDQENDNLFLIMDYVEHGAVMQGASPKPISEDEARRYFRDLIKGLEYLHSQNVIHRDIKPENLLLTRNGEIKIGDFGVSDLMQDGNDMVINTAGSAAFMAPEMVAGNGFFHGKLADIWSCGVTLYMFVTGRCPFWADTVPAIYEQILSNYLTFPEKAPLSADVRHLLDMLLQKDPEKRLTIAQIKKHPWVTKKGAWPMPDLDGNGEHRLGTLAASSTKSWVMLSKVKVRMSARVKKVRMRMSALNAARPFDGPQTPPAPTRFDDGGGGIKPRPRAYDDMHAQ